MDARTFAVAVQMEEIGHRIKLDIKRMNEMASFDSKMCLSNELGAKSRFEKAAQKLEEAGKLFAEGSSDFMMGYSMLNRMHDGQDILVGYAQKFLE